MKLLHAIAVALFGSASVLVDGSPPASSFNASASAHAPGTSHLNRGFPAHAPLSTLGLALARQQWTVSPTGSVQLDVGQEKRRPHHGGRRRQHRGEQVADGAQRFTTVARLESSAEAVAEPREPSLAEAGHGVRMGVHAHAELLRGFCGLLFGAVAMLAVLFCMAATESGSAASKEPLLSGQHPAPALFASEFWLLALLCATSAIEGADVALLPSSMFALQADLGLQPSQLATLSLWQALLGALAAPMWGILADRGLLSRRAILAIGCAGWGLITVLLALVSSWAPMVVLRALNGVMLACLRPISNGLVPDFVLEDRRGEVYGKIQLSFDIGSMLGAMIVTPMSTQEVLGMQGWRVAFLIVGALSLVLSALVALTMHEPPSPGAKAASEGPAVSICEAWREEWSRLLSYLRMPTFSLIIVQGFFGMIPWNALGYSTLFLQTAGLSSGRAALVCTIGRASTGVGHLLGGYIGDFSAARWPGHGRPLVAQLSVLSGIPVLWLMFQRIDPSPEAFASYCWLSVLLGLTSTWCAAGVNWPIFTEIVPAEGRSAIVAWDTALEGISGALLGNLGVATLSQQFFGYRLDDSMPSSANLGNARALGQALAWTTIVPLPFCFMLYSAMHWSYPRDLRRAAAVAKELGKTAGGRVS
mmetsp:Transcript_2696/g.10505  ORF Transcript_2696/g.10505 Transcript_2696/m.10505 type:complete len:647 (+) Transcript_2696:128-2068(+)